jgi:MFS family permease
MYAIPRYRYLLAALIFLVRTCGAFIMLVPTLYMAEIAVDLGIPPELTGAYVGLYVGFISWACAIFVLFSGPIASKIGAKWCSFIGAVFMFLGAFLTAFNPPNFYLACIIRFIFGIGLVLAVIGFTPITQTWFTSEEYGRVTGIIEASSSFGIMLNFLFTPRFFASYRDAHLAYSIPMAILAILWAILGKNPLVPSPKSEESYIHMLKTRLPQAIAIREVIGMSILMLFSMGAGTALISWISSYFSMEWKWRPEIAALIVTVHNVFGITGWPLGGTISDKIGRRKPLFILSGAMVFLCAFTAITFVGPASWIWFGLVGLFIGLNGSCIMAVLMEHPQMTFDLLPVSISIVLCLGFLGQAIMPMVLGAFLDATGSLYLGILFNASLYIVGSIIGIIIRETGWKAATRGV